MELGNDPVNLMKEPPVHLGNVVAALSNLLQGNLSRAESDRNYVRT